LTEFNDARHVRVAPGVLSREVHGESVLLQLDSGEYFGLDEVGTRVWQLITELGDLQAVEAAMCDEYLVEPAHVSHDVRALVGELLNRHLLEVVAPGLER
jgi:hypothetical protein